MTVASRFGGDSSSQEVSISPGGTLVRSRTSTLTYWTGPGGTQFTDLRLVTDPATSVSSIAVDANGFPPEFDIMASAVVTRAWASTDGGVTGKWVSTVADLPTALSATFAARWATLRHRLKFTDGLLNVMDAPPTVTWGTSNPISPSTLLPYTSQRVTFEGGYPADNATFSFRENGVNQPGAPAGFQQVFDHYGTKFAFHIRSFDTVGGYYWIEVDGALTQLTPSNPTVAVSSGGGYWCLVDFGTAALRRIRIYMWNAQWQHLSVGNSDSVSPAFTTGPKLLVYGDSFVGVHDNANEQQGMVATLGRMLGCQVANCGQGGTGYNQDGPAPAVRYEDAGRLSNAAAFDPELVVVFGTINDDAQGGTQAVQDAAASVYSQWATLAPDATLFVVGPPPNHTTPPANRTAARDRIKTAALAAPNVAAFIDPIAGTWQARDGRTGGDGTQWITGTGNVSGPVGDGNADYFIASDNTHPHIPDGDDYLARRIAATLIEIIGGM